MLDDSQLLSEYRANGSEKAFGELVSRYLDLVFSAALRLVGRDYQLAQDVSQKVFTSLAQKGRELPPTVILGGWLYRHTFFVASQTVREERRRRLREEQAAFMNAPIDESKVDWETLAPALEEAMQELDTRDRDALILRFFQGRDLRAVGAALGTSEDAARMRISRAIDKLKGQFEKKGIHVSSVLLATLLAANAVCAAPVGMAAAVTSSALTAAAVAGTSVGLGKILVMKKLALGLLGTASVAGIAVSLVAERQLSQSRQENALLRDQIQQLQSAPAQNTNLLTISADELDRLRKQENELLRLRGENGLLRDQAKKAKPAAQIAAAPSSQPVEKLGTSKARAVLRFDDTMVMGGVELHPGKRTYVFVAPHAVNETNSHALFQATVVEAPDAVWQGMQLNLNSSAQPSSGAEVHNVTAILNPQSAETVLKALEQMPEAQILSRPRILTAAGVPCRFHVGGGDDGMNFDMDLDFSMGGAPNSLDLNVATRIEPGQ